MIVSCSNCSASLQIDESKVSSERFAVRCPKCQQTIQVQLPKSNQNSDQPGNQSDLSRGWETAPAPVYKKKSADQTAQQEVEPGNDLLRLLSSALQQNTAKPAATAAHNSQTLKRTLICLGAQRCEAAAGILDDAGFQVFLAENPAQATEKIRDEAVDIIIFSPDFALKFGGAGVVQQMIHNLTPRERRKIFVISLEDGSQTFNTHDAFMRNLNLIVNNNDLHHLPSILNRALREYDELYRHYNQAVNSLN